VSSEETRQRIADPNDDAQQKNIVIYAIRQGNGMLRPHVQQEGIGANGVRTLNALMARESKVGKELDDDIIVLLGLEGQRCPNCGAMDGFV
jgi:hypothetical protein